MLDSDLCFDRDFSLDLDRDVDGWRFAPPRPAPKPHQTEGGGAAELERWGLKDELLFDKLEDLCLEVVLELDLDFSVDRDLDLDVCLDLRFDFKLCPRFDLDREFLNVCLNLDLEPNFDLDPDLDLDRDIDLDTDRDLDL